MKMAFEIFGDALAVVAIFGTVYLFLFATSPLEAAYETQYEVEAGK